MAAAVNGVSQNWFTVAEELSRSVTSNEVIDVSEIAAVCFNNDVTLTIGSCSEAFILTGGVPLGIDYKTETISVLENEYMFAMRR